MLPSRGMGAISSRKMPKGISKKRRDDTDFTEYSKGGAVEVKKSKQKRRAELMETWEKMRK